MERVAKVKNRSHAGSTSPTKRAATEEKHAIHSISNGKRIPSVGKTGVPFLQTATEGTSIGLASK